MTLKPREIELLRLLGRYGRLKLVAQELGVKHQTVKNDLSHIYRVLEVPSGPAAIYKVFVVEDEAPRHPREDIW